MNPPVRDRRRGWSLLELLIGLSLGLLAAMAGTAAIYAMHAAYGIVAEAVQLEQRGMQALDLLTGLLRQAGWQLEPSPAAAASKDAPPLSGRDDCGQPVIAGGIGCGRNGVAGSDALLIRLGSESGGAALPDEARYADRFVTDCSGYPLVPRSLDYAGGGLRGTSVVNLVYVGTGSDGEPQLLCRYPGRAGGWATAAVARGVETLQLRYGLSSVEDGRVDQFLRAHELDELGPGAWRAVRAVQVAMVLRAGLRVRAPASMVALLPRRWPGETGDDIAFAAASRPEALRRAFVTTVRLRNAPSCTGSAC